MLFCYTVKNATFASDNTILTDILQFSVPSESYPFIVLETVNAVLQYCSKESYMYQSHLISRKTSVSSQRWTSRL